MHFSSRLRASVRTMVFCALILATAATVGYPQTSITLKGKNGSEAEFVAIFDAAPDVLIALQTPNGTAIRIPWDKLDLDDLKKRNGAIFAAYQKAVMTTKAQPLGLGLAENMLSLAQLPSALKQAVRNPYEWTYAYYSPYVYTYRTTTNNGSGEVVVQTRTTEQRASSGSAYAGIIFLTMKRLRDSKDDKEKKELLYTLKTYDRGVAMMIDRIDSVLDRIPPEKVFRRDATHITLIRSADRFRTRVRALLSADVVTQEDQEALREFFTLVDVR